jgi:hypothetical protein
MPRRMLTPFALGARVMVASWAGAGYGTVETIGRKYVTIALEGGGAVRLHPAMLLRDCRLPRPAK